MTKPTEVIAWKQALHPNKAMPKKYLRRTLGWREAISTSPWSGARQRCITISWVLAPDVERKKGQSILPKEKWIEVKGNPEYWEIGQKFALFNKNWRSSETFSPRCRRVEEGRKRICYLLYPKL